MTLGCNRPRLGESNIIPVFTDPLFGQDIFAVNILTSVYVCLAFLVLTEVGRAILSKK